ncbi:MAG: ABC transporter permease subunit [Solidesulfovibrio sp.]|uniref:ABC transporter permease subunit n=1 Tax=Solidesulfovibrio sp. TaxID=2910990 RepID=UPI002B1FF0EC|nr:ABC transporter permease subunit [Solidesulfovibrio sp.]MEA4855410.1 ABC transporter permease subunit [Solidesulfovibrio sp.]
MGEDGVCRNENRLVQATWLGALYGSTGLCALAVAAVFAFLLYFAAPVFWADNAGSVLSLAWRPLDGSFGILSMAAASLALAVSAMLVAMPAGIGICCFTCGLGPPMAARLVLGLVRFMTSIPTVVYGFVSVFALTPIIQAVFRGSSGFCWLTAGLTLSLLVLPTVVLLLEGPLRDAWEHTALAASALGLDASRTLLHVALPRARRSIAAAAVLGFSRAIGDTLIALMLAGNAPQLPLSPLDSIRTLTAHIALVVSTESGSRAYNSLFAAGLLLLGAATAVNLILRRLLRKTA